VEWRIALRFDGSFEIIKSTQQIKSADGECVIARQKWDQDNITCLNFNEDSDSIMRVDSYFD